MDNNFLPEENLYRAVYPPDQKEMFWKKDGTISSVAFADSRGLSVDRGNHRSDSEAIADMLSRLNGCIVSVTVGDCLDADAFVRYLPSAKNIYHSEIHGNQETVLLNKSQRRYLALHARLVYNG